MTTIIKKILTKNIPKSILTISIGNIHFLKDVLRAYSFISRKHTFWQIEPPLTLQIAENQIPGPFHWIRMKKLVWMLKKTCRIHSISNLW